VCAILQYLTLYCVSVHTRADQKCLGTVFIVGKLNHLEGTLSYLLKGDPSVYVEQLQRSVNLSVYMWWACFGLAFSLPAVFSCFSVES
jgi:hypothetical protein